MTISPESLEIRPLVLQSVDENGDPATTTVLEVNSIDLHTLNVKDIQDTFSLQYVTGPTQLVSVTISEADRLKLFFAMSDPTTAIMGDTPLANLGQDFGAGGLKTYRRFHLIANLFKNRFICVSDVLTVSSILDLNPDAQFFGSAISNVTQVLSNGTPHTLSYGDKVFILNGNTDTQGVFEFKQNAINPTGEGLVDGLVRVPGSGLYDQCKGQIIIVANGDVYVGANDSVWSANPYVVRLWNLVNGLTSEQLADSLNIANEINLGSYINILTKNLENDSGPLPVMVALNQVRINANNMLEFYTKSWDGFNISMPLTAALDLQVGDSYYVEFTARDEGLISVPKVTGLAAPVEGSDAINLAHLDSESLALENADTAKIAYMDQKAAELLELASQQDSFFGKANSRWDTSKVLVMNGSGQENLLSFADPSKLSLGSTTLGISLANPVIDESEMTLEEIAASYQRRVYTAGIVRNVVEGWESPRGDLFLGPNGTIVESAPTSGRVFKLGKKLNSTDMLISTQDLGFISGVSTKRKEYDFGDLEPAPMPEPQTTKLMLHFDTNLSDSSSSALTFTATSANGTLPMIKSTGGAVGARALLMNPSGDIYGQKLTAQNNQKINLTNQEFCFETFFRIKDIAQNQWGIMPLFAIGDPDGVSPVFQVMIAGFDVNQNDDNMHRSVVFISTKGLNQWYDHYTTDFSLSIDSWNHIAVVKDFTKNYTIYINGESVGIIYDNEPGDIYHNPAFIAQEQITVGHRPDDGRNFCGFLDEVQLTVGDAKYRSNFTVTLPEAL